MILLKNLKDSKVKVVAVTKNRTVPEILKVIDQGIDTIGENRIQEAEEKFSHLPTDLEKHFIGHLQSNKVKKACELFDVIESVDSYKLAEKINSVASGKIPIFIQVNISREEQKGGILEEDLAELVRSVKKLPNLELRGFMAIIENTEDHEKRTQQFKKMKELQEEYGLPELSMGMSNDWEEAIKHGATQVRLGRILFENL